MNLPRDLEPVWLVSTTDKKLTRQELQRVDVEESTRQLLRKKVGGVSLRVESQLLYGLATVVNRKGHILLEDSNETNRGLIKLFSQNEIDLVTRPDSSELTLASQPSQIVDLLPQDLNLDQVLAKINTTDTLTHSQVASSEIGSSELGIDVDQSVDLVTRRGEGDNELDESILRQSETDEQILSRLDLTENVLSDLGDFDMDVSLGDSSPPPEVSTPLGDEQMQDIMIVDSDPEIPQARAKKRPAVKKLAPLDAETTAALPSRPADKILTNPPTLTSPVFSVIDKLLDPDYIRTEIKRRRLLGSDDADEDFDIPELDQTADFDNSDAMEEEEDVPVSPSAVAPLPPLEDAGAMEVEARKARDALEAALEKGPAIFQSIGSSRVQKAAAFAEMLSMAAKGQVKLHQRSAFSDIRIQQK